MKSIAVFCGSSSGTDPLYTNVALTLGKMLARRGIQLVYGGAKVGLMGVVADGVLNEGGKVIGVLPRFLTSKEIRHDGLTELVMVESMHERKTKMHDLSDGVIALPGGFGTLEELFEMLTWAQLGLHGKPIGLLNVNGFYNGLDQQLNCMVDEGFLKSTNYNMLLIDNDAGSLLEKMAHYKAPHVGKWISEDNV